MTLPARFELDQAGLFVNEIEFTITQALEGFQRAFADLSLDLWRD